jgi:hypothetical protein
VKKNKRHQPTSSRLTILNELCNLIPPHLVPKLARETAVEQKARTFTPWSHVVALLYAQLTHSLGLNDVCDALQLHSGPLSAVRAARAPYKNTFSHANRTRDPKLGERLFYSMLEHLEKLQPGFGGKHRPRFAFRFKRIMHVVDSTTIGLMARSLDWAKHLRRKAAAKCHLRLDLQTFLPRYAIVETAAVQDCRRARELCAAIRPGEIVIFDKAYTDFSHLADLSMREVFFVTRARDDLRYRVVRKLQPGRLGNILRDEVIRWRLLDSREAYPENLRRVSALVEVEGQQREMAFLTNNFSWSPHTIADLYRCRWQIEKFFKELKQTLQLADFLGHSEGAVKWQVWTALLAYLLLRFCAWLSQWSHSFTRLFALLRSALWQKLQLRSLLLSCGTAAGGGRFLGQPEQAYFAGFR